MSTGQQATSPIVTACPQCGAGLLNAIVRLSLFGVSLEDGLVVDYDGGPQPESEADIIELCAEDNTIIFCEAGHIIGNVSGAQPDPLQILERIAHWPANSNSDPDVMGAALDEITPSPARRFGAFFPSKLFASSKATATTARRPAITTSLPDTETGSTPSIASSAETAIG